jgi:hypothetical protein
MRRVYVADCNNHRIQVLTDHGAFLRNLRDFSPGEGQVHIPKAGGGQHRASPYGRFNHRRIQDCWHGAALVNLS